MFFLQSENKIKVVNRKVICGSAEHRYSNCPSLSYTAVSKSRSVIVNTEHSSRWTAHPNRWADAVSSLAILLLYCVEVKNPVHQPTKQSQMRALLRRSDWNRKSDYWLDDNIAWGPDRKQCIIPSVEAVNVRRAIPRIPSSVLQFIKKNTCQACCSFITTRGIPKKSVKRWEWPDQMLIFFRDRLPTQRRKWSGEPITMQNSDMANNWPIRALVPWPGSRKSINRHLYENA